MSSAPLHDVAVVGAGGAGLGAALAAAAQGARTLLVERATELGGNTRQAQVHTLCGLYLPEGESARCAHPGLPTRVAEDLLRTGAAATPVRAGRVWYLPIDPRRFAERARKWCSEAPRLELRTQCALVGLDVGDEGHWRLALQGASGPERCSAKIVIDASGDAAAAVATGAAFAEEAPERLQAPSYIAELAGVDTAELEGFARLGVSHALAGAVRRGDLAGDCDSVAVRPGPMPGQLFLTLNVPRPTRPPYAPLDDDCRLGLESGARRAVEAVVGHLRRHHPAFAECRIASWPDRLGIRETRRLRGRVELRREDVLSGQRREDQVALSTWPIELWDDHRRARFSHPEAPCSVPLGSLVSSSHARLGMAGRCMAGSHDALGALRVIGTALATGEAIGVAAAIAADEGSTLVDVEPARVRERASAGAAAIS